MFRALPFWLSPAPYAFSRVVKAVVKHCCRYGDVYAWLSQQLAPTISFSDHFSDSQQTTTTNGFGPGICSKLGQIGAGFQSECKHWFWKCQQPSQLLLDRSIPFWDKWSIAWLLPDGRTHKRLLQWHVKDRWCQTDGVMGSSYFTESLVQPCCLPVVEKGLPNMQWCHWLVLHQTSWCSRMLVWLAGALIWAISQLLANGLPIGRIITSMF